MSGFDAEGELEKYPKEQLLATSIPENLRNIHYFYALEEKMDLVIRGRQRWWSRCGGG